MWHVAIAGSPLIRRAFAAAARPAANGSGTLCNIAAGASRACNWRACCVPDAHVLHFAFLGGYAYFDAHMNRAHFFQRFRSVPTANAEGHVADAEGAAFVF